ncbi:MAG: hypothetical protein V1758_15625 [Pseudomonadota bacterium]
MRHRENTLVGAEFISALRAHVKYAPTFSSMGVAGTQVMRVYESDPLHNISF